jgi:3-phosphoshikimate 1-carboxyvinyltransferase
MDISITPAPLLGLVSAIASKSDAHRLLICAALSDKKTVLKIPERSVDIDTTAQCLAALGAGIEYADGRFSVTPVNGTSGAALDCCESGSTLRFLLPIAAAISDSADFTGRGKLPERPIGELVNALRLHGVNFTSDKLPLRISGHLTGGDFTLPGNVSSQYISGLLMTLPLVGGGTIKLSSSLQSSSYVDMTISTMGRFGVSVIKSENGFTVPAGQKYSSPDVITADGDWSNAAFFLAAGAIGSTVTVAGLNTDSVQGDKKILDILRRFGASVEFSGDSIIVTHAPLTGCDIDISDIPDLLPILAVTASFCDGETRFYNGARLRIKESDRLSSVAALLNSLGGDVTELPDGLIVRKAALHGGIVDGFNDHRIVMSAAIAAAFCEGEVTIKGANAVNKSYPTFFEDYRKLGGIANVI